MSRPKLYLGSVFLSSIFGAFVLYSIVIAQADRPGEEIVALPREVLSAERYTWAYRETKINRDMKEEWDANPNGADVFVAGETVIEPVKGIKDQVAAVSTTISTLQGNRFGEPLLKKDLVAAFGAPSFRVVVEKGDFKVQPAEKASKSLCRLLWSTLNYKLPAGKGMLGSCWKSPTNNVGDHIDEGEPILCSPQYLLCSDFGTARNTPLDKSIHELLKSEEGLKLWQDQKVDVVALLGMQAGPAYSTQHIWLIERGTSKLIFARTTYTAFENANMYVQSLAVSRKDSKEMK